MFDTLFSWMGYVPEEALASSVETATVLAVALAISGLVNVYLAWKLHASNTFVSRMKAGYNAFRTAEKPAAE